MYHFLFRWEEDVYPRADTLARTVSNARDIALKRNAAPVALQRYTPAQAALIRTIAAGVALHLSGAFSRLLRISSDDDVTIDEHEVAALKEIFFKLYADAKLAEQVARAVGLRKHEIEAVWSYTQANKEVAQIEGIDNPSFMQKTFGPYKDGWAALTGAMNKLPDFRKLGLTVCTMRTVRSSKETTALSRLPIGARLVLGCNPMKGGQRHVTSTALTMSKWTLPSTVKESGGVICYFGVSGVFINWLGEYTLAMDGGEVLYPFGTIMQLSSKQARGYDDGSPLFVLEEVPSFEPSNMNTTPYYDDFSFTQITSADPITAARSAARSYDMLDLGVFDDGPLAPQFFDH